MSFALSFILDALILLAGWTHVLLSPYTKVEESFNLHATHDVLMYGISEAGLVKYDHFTFPGAVPRTFIGSVILAYLSKPVINLASAFGYVEDKFDLQLIVRLVLSTLNALGLLYLRRAVSRRFGRTTSISFTFLTISQFHIPFWMGRTLPNMFAFLPVNIAMYLLIGITPRKRNPSPLRAYTSIAILTATAVIFRAELALLLAPLCVQFLVTRTVSFVGLVKVGTIAGLAAIALTISVDTYFWRTSTPLWPEFAGIWFNVFEGKSSEWGVSPPHAYLTTHLPKLLLTSLPLSVLGFLADSRVRGLLLPHIAFILLISGLGHKEWRFIVYSVPVFNVGAARGLGVMLSIPRKFALKHKCRTVLLVSAVAVSVGMIVVNLTATILTTSASMANYPGGEALGLFNDIVNTSSSYSSSTSTGMQIQSPHVHISNLAAQTGASLFLQVHSPPFLNLPLEGASTYGNGNKNGGNGYSTSDGWTKYDKTESLSFQEIDGMREITHMISEEVIGSEKWKLVGSVEGFDGWDVNLRAVKWRGVLDGVKMRKRVMLWIYERV